MASLDEQELLDLLKEFNYTFIDSCKKDIFEALDAFAGLSLKKEKYVFSNGNQKDLISLCGTIPVSFNGISSDVPIQLYLSEFYPRSSPIVYVRPTPCMTINVNKTTQINGRIRLPYLQDWNRTSDLNILLNCLVIEFGERMPLSPKAEPTPHIKPTTPSIPWVADIHFALILVFIFIIFYCFMFLSLDNVKHLLLN